MPLCRILLSVVFVACTAATACADTVRVIVERALVWTQPSGVSIVMSQLLQGQTAEVVRRVGDWYEIVAPPGSGGGDRRTGFISASQVELVPGGTTGQPATPARRAPAAAATATASKSRDLGGIVHVDGIFRAGGKELVRTTTAFTEQFAEAGTITSRYGKRSGAAFGVLVAKSLWGPLGIGGAVDYYMRKPDVAVEAHVPHPFFFNQPRTATFETQGLSSREVTIHVPVMWTIPDVGPLRVVVYGGPSIFFETQTVVADLKLNEQYPYDTVQIAGATTADRKSTLFGFHAGADASYFFTPTIGVGAGLRYSHARLKFDNDASTTTDGSAGAVAIAGGVRVRF